MKFEQENSKLNLLNMPDKSDEVGKKRIKNKLSLSSPSLLKLNRVEKIWNEALKALPELENFKEELNKAIPLKVQTLCLSPETLHKIKLNQFIPKESSKTLDILQSGRNLI